MARYVVGDIHGNIKALKQVLKACQFNYEKDMLICLGDVCDGHQHVKECFDELLKVKNLKYIMGNHDYWAYQWFAYHSKQDKLPDQLWFSQGGRNTLISYGARDPYDMTFKLEQAKMPLDHLIILNQSVYFLVLENSIFVHGGLPQCGNLSEFTGEDFMWDRSMLGKARMVHPVNPDWKACKGKFDRIFIGHTAENDGPNKYCNIWNLDTGAGWNGRLTIMDIDTEVYWQSDIVEDLYDYESPR